MCNNRARSPLGADDAVRRGVSVAGWAGRHSSSPTVVTFLDAHLQPLAAEPVIIALIGASALVLAAAGLALYGLRKAGSRREPTPAPGHRSPPDAGLRFTGAPPTPAVQPGSLGRIDRLADVLDRSRRLIAAEERVAHELACAGGWVVERYVLVGTRRVPFVLLGPGGVFMLCTTDGAWTMYDLEVLSRLGDELRERLPGYRGRVEAVVCLAFDHAEPRAWYGGADSGGRGGWVLGVDQLLPWLSGSEPQHGLAPDDLRRIATEAGPHWRRRSTPRLPISGSAG
jgi:hypothetical protein